MISLNPKTSVIIDSNVFIALWHSKDTHAQDARSILTKVAEGEIQHVYLTNYAFGYPLGLHSAVFSSKFFGAFFFPYPHDIVGI